MIRIYYDPPPQPLTRGQVAHADCYNYGTFRGTLSAPLAEGFGTPYSYFSQTYCRDPYGVPADTPPPTSAQRPTPTPAPPLRVLGQLITHAVALGRDGARLYRGSRPALHLEPRPGGLYRAGLGKRRR